VRSLTNDVTTFAGFYALNETQGVELWYGGIQMGGTNPNVILNLSSKGAESIIFNTNSTPRMALNSNGRLLVGSGVTDNGATIQASGDIRADYTSSIYLQINGGAAGDYRKGFSGINQESGVARGLHIFNYDPDSSQGIKFYGGTFGSRIRFGGFHNDGNFFINTADLNAGFKFDCNGTGRFSGELFTSLSNGVIRLRDNGTAQVEVNIRHSSTRNGVLSFTQEAVADRWAIGTRPNDGTLYFSANFDLSTPRLTIASNGQATFSLGIEAKKALFGVSGVATPSLIVNDNDQSNVRLRLQNSTSGNTWDLVGGVNAANNSDFSIYDVSNNVTALRIIPVSGAATFSSSVVAGSVIAWNGGVGALSFNTGVVTMETNSATRIELKTNGTTALTLQTNQTARFANLLGIGRDPSYALDALGSIRGSDRLYWNGLSQLVYILNYDQIPNADTTTVADSTATNGFALRKSGGSSTFFFGNYTSFPPGNYTAYFRLKVASNASGSSLGTLDVVGSTMIGFAITLRPNMFAASDTWQYIKLPFTVTGNGFIEWRLVSWTGITDTFFDHIMVYQEGGEGNVFTRSAYSVYVNQNTLGMQLNTSGALTVTSSVTAGGVVTSNTGFLINSGQYNSISETPYTGIFMTAAASADGFGALLVTSRTDVARPIIFGTSNGSVSTERMRITAAGNLDMSANSDINFGGSGKGIYLSRAGLGPRASLTTRSGTTWVDIANSSDWSGVTIAASGGNVLIGTTTDGGVNRVLSVERNQNAISGVAMVNSTSGTNSSSQFIISAHNSSGFYGAFASTHSITEWAGRSVFGCNDTSSGITVSAHNSNQDIRFITNNTSGVRMVITNGGNVLIGATNDTGARLRIVGATNSSFDFGLTINNLGNNSLFAVRDDGVIQTGFAAAGSPTNNTTSSAANLNVDSSGVLRRSTSSLKYKKNVKNYEKGLNEVMQLRPVSYQGKNPADGNQNFAGLIAEEVHNLGLTEFVQYAKDGSPDALSYQNMIALLTKAIQELKNEIETLKN
jgi:hypothetical protein